jgi:glucosamine--fructose-6-phosphate aminotransferase (isomerizing)
MLPPYFYSQVEYASEFRYRTPILFAEDIVIAISQSGETADTLAALQLARAAGCLCLGVCNTVGSSIARETHAGIYLHAGPEIGVASTKAFSAQVRVATLLVIVLPVSPPGAATTPYPHINREARDWSGKHQGVLCAGGATASPVEVLPVSRLTGETTSPHTRFPPPFSHLLTFGLSG